MCVVRLLSFAVHSAHRKVYVGSASVHYAGCEQLCVYVCVCVCVPVALPGLGHLITSPKTAPGSGFGTCEFLVRGSERGLHRVVGQSLLHCRSAQFGDDLIEMAAIGIQGPGESCAQTKAGLVHEALEGIA